MRSSRRRASAFASFPSAIRRARRRDMIRKAKAVAFQLQRAGYTPTELSTEAAVTLEQDGAGFRISRSALTLRAQVPNLDEAAFARMASDAEKNCPVSKVLKAEITLDAKVT